MTMLLMLILLFVAAAIGSVVYFVRCKRHGKMRRFWLHWSMGFVGIAAFTTQILVSQAGLIDNYFILLGGLVIMTVLPLFDLRDPILRTSFGLMSGLSLLALVNFVGSYAFFRVDLTAEKRHTLSEQTQGMLQELEDVVYMEIYLEGDFSADFKRLQRSIKEKLDIFRSYSGGNIEYVFIDPAESDDEEEVKSIYKQLSERGMFYTTEETGSGTVGQRYIWPGALVRYQGNEQVINFINGQAGSSYTEIVDHAIEEMEYEISNTIRKFTIKNARKIGFLEGHGELHNIYLQDFRAALEEYYVVDRVKIDGDYQALNDYDAIIIAKPDSAFSDGDRFILDHFIMNGGKTMWLVDPTNATMDTLLNSATPTLTMATARPLNIESQLFRYGARINNDLVLDKRCAPIQLPANFVGQQAVNKAFPWYFSPIVTPISQHQIVKNLDAIRLNFASTIDTVGGPEVRKTVLLHTSRLAQVRKAPVRLSLGIAVQDIPDEVFRNPFKPVAVLLEGTFESAFRNFRPPGIESVPGLNLRDTSIENSMIVIGDGDIIANPGNLTTNRIWPLGVDPAFPGLEFRNKTFLLNCVNYLLDDEGLMILRTREVSTRLLDEARVRKDRELWQFINVAAPILVILFMALTQHLVRRRINRKNPIAVHKVLFYVNMVLPPIAITFGLVFLSGLLLALVFGAFFSYWWIYMHNRLSYPKN